MTYPGTMDPGWYTRDPEELLEHVDLEDLTEEGERRIRVLWGGTARRLAQPVLCRYLEAEAWDALTGREHEETSRLYNCLCPRYVEPDVLAELGCEARRRGEDVSRED